MDLSRLSLNQITTERLTLAEAIAACRRHHIRHIGVWRHKLSECGLSTAASLIRDNGLSISGLCRGGMFPAPTQPERQQRIDENRKAIDEAAALGTDVLVLVCGPATDRDLPAARAMVADGISAIRDHARAAKIRVAIEPLHPMFAADRSVITTLAEANTLAERLDVAVIVDAYHVWWDPDLPAQIHRAGPRIAGFHVSDWLVPLPDIPFGRGMMGDGVIALREISKLIDNAGYSGPIEVEIFNRDLQARDPDLLLATLCERFRDYV
jgi:sugar phosphate isomerase/epimerase